MADLSSAFDDSDIDHLIEQVNTTTEYPRWYLGMSGLGSSCMRKLWYDLRWVKKKTISARLNRLFRVGHDQEEKIVRDLEAVGIKCSHVVEDQLEFVECNGWLRGHSDGKGIGVPEAPKTPHLLEFKTACLKKFKEFAKKGVEKTSYMYYCQMILYMYEMKLTRALFVVYCKDNSEYYFERVHADTGLAKELIGKAQDIIKSRDVEAFSRIGNNTPNWFECKWCEYSDICFKNEAPENNCRNCNWSDFVNGGKVACIRNKGQILSSEMQAKKYECYNILDCLK